jgi:hypothetical protein
MAEELPIEKILKGSAARNLMEIIFLYLPQETVESHSVLFGIRSEHLKRVIVKELTGLCVYA